jgi:hypothetical protein
MPILVILETVDGRSALMVRKPSLAETGMSKPSLFSKTPALPAWLRLPQLLLSTLILVLTLLAPQCLAQQREQVEDDRSPDALKVLFIGNSYTFANNMPRIFASLVHSGNSSKPLKIYSSSFPSYTLREHLNDNRTLSALEHEGPWDYVVLQERSYFPITEPKQMEDACVELNKKIKGIGARTVLLQTWADLKTPEYQPVINNVCRKIGNRIGATVVSAGEIWPSAARSAQLYGEDGHHPSVAGSFLVACCLYKALLGKDPRTLPGETESSLGLSPNIARQIKDLVSSGPGASYSAATAAGTSRNTGRRGSTQPSSAGTNQTRGVTNYRW